MSSPSRIALKIVLMLLFSMVVPLIQKTTTEIVCASGERMLVLFSIKSILNSMISKYLDEGWRDWVRHMIVLMQAPWNFMWWRKNFGLTDSLIAVQILWSYVDTTLGHVFKLLKWLFLLSKIGLILLPPWGGGCHHYFQVCIWIEKTINRNLEELPPTGSEIWNRKRLGTTLGERRDFKRSKLLGEMASMNESIRGNRKIYGDWV